MKILSSEKTYCVEEIFILIKSITELISKLLSSQQNLKLKINLSFEKLFVVRE